MPPLWWHAVGRRNINVHVIANVELGLEQCQIVVGVPLSRAGDANLAHPIASAVRLDERKIKVGSLATSLRVDVAHQRGELLQRGVLPGVDLELVGGHVAVLVVGRGVMAPGGAKDAQQQRAGLGRGRMGMIKVNCLGYSI